MLSYFLAALPVLVILVLMVAFRLGAQTAGLAGWIAGIVIAALAFGLNWDVFWVSQLKGLLLSLYLLVILWPALMLYHLVNQVGGIQAVALGMENVIGDRGVLLVVMAWAFSGLLEGLAGFGLPVAIVSPIMVGLGIPPVIAVAAVAAGHAWAVSFGGMGVVFQTLLGVSGLEASVLAFPAAVAVSVACVACGFAAASILGQLKSWWKVILIALVMCTVLTLLAVSGISPIASFGAGLSGVLAGYLLGRKRNPSPLAAELKTPLRLAVLSYGGLAALMVLLALPGPLKDMLGGVVWKPLFPEVITGTGFVTAAGAGQIFKPLLHPGSTILLVALLAYAAFRLFGHSGSGALRGAMRETWKSAAPATVGVLFTVGLATLMEHSGMTMLLAQGASTLMQGLYPLVSPLVGVLGAFATGSNNNSNVLFANLQKEAAILLGLSPAWLVGAQTAGGSLGSMIAPPKIIVGCSTTGQRGQEGAVLRITFPYVVGIALLVGLVVLIFAGG